MREPRGTPSRIEQICRRCAVHGKSTPVKPGSMSEFPLYLEIVHEYKPNIQETENLLELLHARDANECTHDEFLILLDEFNQYIEKAQRGSDDTQIILSYDDFMTLLTPQMNFKQMHQLLVGQILKELPNSLIILYFQFLNLLNPHFVSTDEVQLILLTVLNQNEIRSYNDLLDLATQTLNDLNCIKGLVPQSKFILFLHEFDLDEGSMKQDILRLQQMQISTFSDLLKQKISEEEILNYLLYNWQIYQIRFGCQINQQMINEIVSNVIAHFQQRNVNVNKMELTNELTSLFVEYEVEIQKILQYGIAEPEKEVSEQVTRHKIDESQGEFAGFDIDQLIIAAEWEEVDLNAPIDLSQDIEGQKLMESYHASMFEQERPADSRSKEEEQDVDELSQFMNTGMVTVNSSMMNQNSFLLTSQKFNGRLIGQKDDSVMKKLRKVLGSMK